MPAYLQSSKNWPEKEHAPKEAPKRFAFWLGQAVESHDRVLRLCRQSLRGRLEGPCAKEKIHDVPFMRLQPIEFDGWDGAEVEAVDVGGVEELAFPGFV